MEALKKILSLWKTPLSELLEDEKQKLLYVFDPLAERVFFIELSEIITGKDLQHATCSHKEEIHLNKPLILMSK